MVAKYYVGGLTSKVTRLINEKVLFSSSENKSEPNSESKDKTLSSTMVTKVPF